MKFLLDEFQEGEMPFGEMHSPYREVNKIISLDLCDKPVTTSAFLTTLSTLKFSLIQSLCSSMQQLAQTLSIQSQDFSTTQVTSQLIPTASADIENQLNLITAVDPTEKHMDNVKNHLGNNVGSNLSTSTDNSNKILVSDNIMMPKV